MVGFLKAQAHFEVQCFLGGGSHFEDCAYFDLNMKCNDAYLKPSTYQIKCSMFGVKASNNMEVSLNVMK